MAKNEITRYDGELNTIPLGKLTAAETNLFFSIITKLKDKNTEVVRFYFDELKELSEYKDKSNKKFTAVIRKTYQKLLQLNFGKTSNGGLTEDHFVIFSKFSIHQEVDRPYVDVRVYDEAVPLLNNLDTWVRYSLHEFNSLKSTYAKTLFRLLKEFRTTGFVRMPKDKFNELLAVPKSYRPSNVNTSILKPSIDQLSPYFKNLKVEKEYAKTKGNPLKNYVFTFVKEPKDKDDYQVKKSYKKPTAHKEIATDWSKKKATPKTDINSVSDLLKTLDDSRKEEVKS